jgi:RNA polymerase sigma-70 factor (ECF subfamily)
MNGFKGGISVDDVKLLNLIKTYPEEGMRQLINQYSRLVYTVVKSKISSVCNSSDIEECVADVFSEFYINLDNYNVNLSHIKTYICSIANHRATNIYKEYQKKIEEVSLDDEDVWIQIEDKNLVEKDVLTNEKRKEILDAVKSLGEIDSMIIFLKFYLGESSKEISKRLGLTVSNVDTRTHRALKKLKEKLEGSK